MSKASRPENPEPLMITAKSVSEAYARTLLHVLEHQGNEIAPLVLTMDGFGDGYEIPENNQVRAALDALLSKKKKRDVEDVAYTIFPQRLWTMAQGDRAKLFEFYKMAFPFYRAQNPKANGKGLYFERLMMYGRGPCDGNQLEWILSQYDSRPGVRRSMWQATTFDPARDHRACALHADRIGGHGDGLQTRRAKAVHGDARGGDWQTRAQGDLPRDVRAGRPFGVAAADHHVFDGRRIDARAFHGFGNDMAAHGGTVGHVERPAEGFGQPGADGRDDYGLFHLAASLFRSSKLRLVLTSSASSGAGFQNQGSCSAKPSIAARTLGRP